MILHLQVPELAGMLPLHHQQEEKVMPEVLQWLL